jgi:hypothetical protein
MQIITAIFTASGKFSILTFSPPDTPGAAEPREGPETLKGRTGGNANRGRDVDRAGGSAEEGWELLGSGHAEGASESDKPTAVTELRGV